MKWKVVESHLSPPERIFINFLMGVKVEFSSILFIVTVTSSVDVANFSLFLAKIRGTVNVVSKKRRSEFFSLKLAQRTREN